MYEVNKNYLYFIVKLDIDIKFKVKIKISIGFLGLIYFVRGNNLVFLYFNFELKI